MRKIVSKFALAAGIMLALAFTFSCDSGGGDGTVGGSSSSGGSQGGVSSSSGGGNPGGNVSNCPVSAVSDNSVTCGGQTYRTVQIGSQKWFAENLNYDPGKNDFESACYSNQASNCATYGRLYNWRTAMGVCPSGWHLPSDDEWQTLVDFAGGDDVAGEKLKATDGWNWDERKEIFGNGTDEYGFSALPGGYGSSGVFYALVGDRGYWWSANEDEDLSYYAYSRFMAYGGYIGSVVRRSSDNKSGLYSVRCVQD